MTLSMPLSITVNENISVTVSATHNGAGERFGKDEG